MIEPCEGRVTVAATFPLVKRCPFRDETDRGAVEITWTTLGQTFELHELAAFLAEGKGQEISHEDITHRLAEALDGHDGLIVETVTTRWTTAGGEVTCRAVPGQRVIPEGA
jgi:NADPH-dependent 7-cyano-7-deazaguanine reductase QueF